MCLPIYHSFIKISMHFTSSEVVLKVEDSGCGIPPEQLEQVLQRFHRVESETRREGAGIGLALTSELVKLHQGRSPFHHDFLAPKKHPEMGFDIFFCGGGKLQAGSRSRAHCRRQ